MMIPITCNWWKIAVSCMCLSFCLVQPGGGLHAAETEEYAQSKELIRDEGSGFSEAEQSFCQELEYMDGLKEYVLLPDDYSEETSYPSVYFMPSDGLDAEQSEVNLIASQIHELENANKIAPMIYVFPQLSTDTDLKEQVVAAVKAVEEVYPVIEDASMRAVIGTGAGGYLAFLTGYSMYGGEPAESPELFSAVAAMDGDFTSEQNPWIDQYGDLSSILSVHADSSYGADTQWVSSYYTYLDANAENKLTWEKGSTGDLASIYRADSLVDHRSPSAWDYSVFEYSILSDSHYGVLSDHLERPLSRFSSVFQMDMDAQGSDSDPLSVEMTESGNAETESEILSDQSQNKVGEGIIDLMGDWYFRVATALTDAESFAEANSIGFIMESDWKDWDVVQPGLGWWSEDFADCLEGNANYVGYAWYVREFDVPEGFALDGLQIDAGMVDEADEVYLNGVRIGQTGISKEGGSYDGSNPWEEERIYQIPDGLLHTGTNMIAVRICNGNGGGGWYSGPIQIEPAVDNNVNPAEVKDRFYEESFSSKSLNGMEAEYRVYLPEGYYESDLRYPVIYMLHGYGSTGRSFEIAGVPEVIDEGIASGEIPPCIVIFPTDGHPQKASWWIGPYANMLCDDLVAEVDATLRTVDSRDYRFLAGESMGGGGAYLNALTHKDLFGGVFDIYGDLTDTGVLSMILDMDKDELSMFRQYIICGNHDMYTFDLDHILLGAHLNQLAVPHVFEIDNGEHSSSFYLKYIKEGFGYLLEGLQPVSDMAEATETESGAVK